MYLTAKCGDSNGFFPLNTKWGGTSTLSGLLPGGGLRGGDSPSSTSQPWRSLGYFRPNQAMARGFIPGGGLGLMEVDTGTLALGIGALAIGMFLFGSKHGPRLRQRKASRLRRRLKELES